VVKKLEFKSKGKKGLRFLAVLLTSLSLVGCISNDTASAATENKTETTKEQVSDKSGIQVRDGKSGKSGKAGKVGKKGNPEKMV
jgi:hypothetical protein